MKRTRIKSMIVNGVQCEPVDTDDLNKGLNITYHTDIEKLKAVFDEIGVDYKEEEVEGGKAYSYGSEAFKSDTCIHLNDGIGYMGFYCDMFFLDGKYKGHGCWE